MAWWLPRERFWREELRLRNDPAGAKVTAGVRQLNPHLLAHRAMLEQDFPQFVVEHA